jgi:hypothetical protein
MLAFRCGGDVVTAPDMWWDSKDPGKDAWTLVNHLINTQGNRRGSDADDYLALYFGSTRYGVSGYRTSASSTAPDAPGFNMVQAFSDSLVAMVVRNKVRPYFLTEKGKPEERERAQGMTRVCESELRTAGLYDDVAVDVCFDGTLFDVGCTKWTPDFANKRLVGARVFPWEILVPEREQRLPMPRQWAHVTTYDRGVLRAQHADNRESVQKIDACPPAPRDPYYGFTDIQEDGTVSDLVLVAEVYHLPSGRVDRSDPKAWGKSEKGADARKVKANHDGRRLVVLSNGEVIDDTPWPYENPPFAFYRPMKKPTEWWSRGVPETLFGAQVAVHRMNTRVDAIMNLHARPLLYVWKQAQLNTDKITNAHASILEGMVPAGQALQVFAAQAVPAEYMNRIRELIAWAKEQLGLSDQTVQANKPPGIEHAPALQFLSDLESVRQHPRFRAWESFYVQNSRCIIDCIRMLAEHVPDYEVMWGEDKELKRIAWKEVDLAEDRYRITTWPTNLLPSTPGAKMARLVDMVKNGFLPPQKALLALASDYPDIEALLGDANAFVRNIQEKLNALEKDGDVDRSMPHSLLDLELAKTMVKERMNAAEADGADQEVLDRFETWYDDVDQLLALGAQAAAAQALPPPGMEPGAAPPPMPPEGGPPALPPGGAPPTEIAA